MSFPMTLCAKNDELNKEIARKGNLFAFNFMQQVLAQDSLSPQVVVSPTSCAMALSMLLNGAEGDSYEEIAKALSLEGFSNEQINSYNRMMLKVLAQKDDRILLQIANSVWAADDFSYKCSFKRRLKRYYKVSPYRVDMSSMQTPDIINQWCSDATNGLVDKIIDSTDPSVLMILINAIYFKGDWAVPFEKASSYEAPFYGQFSTSELTFMNAYRDVPYYACDEFRMIELDYSDPNYCMTMILPEEGVEIGEFLSQFSVEEFNQGIASMGNKKTYITIPRVDCEYEIGLNNVLQNMGMVLPFTSAADLSRIADDSMFVSSVIQKCALKVNEEGSEAAAVTAITIMKTSLSPQEPPRFIANRPYLSVIREKSTGTILFMGVMRN